MKKLSILLGSAWLTGVLLIMLSAVVLVEIKIVRDARARWAAADRVWDGSHRANALAHAIEQYCVDFPDAGPLANNREWAERLGGKNPKGIRYLKVEKYSPDANGRLLDACGSPWAIEVPGDPGYERMVTPEPPDEFHVRSEACAGFAFGHRSNPRYSRS